MMIWLTILFFQLTLKHRNACRASFTISQHEFDQINIEKTITEAYDK